MRSAKPYADQARLGADLVWICNGIQMHQFNSDSTTGHQTKESIVFNLSDWTTFKSIVHQINNDFPELAKIKICLHDSLYNLMNCREWNPSDMCKEEMSLIMGHAALYIWTLRKHMNWWKIKIVLQYVDVVFVSLQEEDTVYDWL